MILKNLKISNFKNLPKLNVSFENGIYYFYSPNGTGKTNLLEVIQVLTVGKSLRSKSESDIFNFNKPSKFIEIKGEFEDEDELSFTQSVRLEKDIDSKKKILSHNKNKVSINNYIGNTPSIWFSPESIKIISTSPLNKRKYFDDILIQLYPEYNYNLKAYNRSLRQRNRVLQNPELDKAQIKVWTENLITYGAKIIKDRQKFFQKINQEFAELENFPRYKFKINPVPNIEVSEIFDEDIEYKFRSELQKSYQRDLAVQSTTSGPHKDDWDMQIQILPNKNFISAERFASRGQQRMSLIVLQIVLINIFIKLKEIMPILLLDDIFSELDEENEKILLDFIQFKRIQTFITGVHKLKVKNIEQINLKELI